MKEKKKFCVYVVLIFVLVCIKKKHRDGEKSYITKQNDNHGEERSVLLYLYFSG